MYALHVVLASVVGVVFVLAGLNFEGALLSVAACLLIEALCLGAALVTYLFARK